ncbi:hypothetical protein P389DRAFT_144820 [Cystobasidium minutum MCA 4210]|uniref:mitochondrial 54S ribosomal protein mL46 n=1 Tax=Cystobasidium minutum MCA 4210 TaxID=1397322 RepID=UPI0034CDE72A|eukprot:jgi/Rhomi1/144820/e_gw1.4.1295.1
MQSASSEASTSSTTSAADHVSSTPSTSASSSRSFSTDPKTRIVAAMILSRPPRQMSPLTNFEREYYKYARKVNRALGDRFNPDWYFRKGSQAEQAFKDLTEGKELLTYPSAEEVTETAEDKDLHNLERRKDRTLYLLAKKKRSQHVWQFPQGGVENRETLSQAAIRELLEEFGSDLDVWQTGKIPAAFYGYDLPKATSEGHTRTKVFYMPARIMRGTPRPNKEEGLEDYAWCTREEVHEKIQNEAYWNAVRPVLSH